MAENIKPTTEEKTKDTYAPQGDEKKVLDEFRQRKSKLLTSRNAVNGVNIDEQMRRHDTDYFNREAQIPASELDPDQKPLAINGAYAKVQTALSILIDKNPEYVLEEAHDKYTANRELVKTLAQRSWRKTNSLGQLKLSVFNSAKRGWGVGRTFYRELKHDARFLTAIDEQGNKKYQTKEITKVDDVAYMNLDNHNVWIDEEALPEDMYSVRDWMWRVVWHIDTIKAMFPESEYPNMKFVKEGGNTAERVEGNSSTQGNSTNSSPKETKDGMTEVYFYEHQYLDRFIVEVNGVMVVWEPLPQMHKRLSLVFFPWHLRSAETIYGIGIIEEMEREDSLIDRILNMDMRQLLLTISPYGFYSGTDDMEDENMKTKPGVFRRVLDPNGVNWVQVPQGNRDGLEKIGWIEQRQDARTGINKTVEGEVATGGGDTAFELGVARESALKRLRLPLRSIQYGLEWEFANRIDLIKQVYSRFQVEHIANTEEILDYLEEVEADPEFYFIQNEGSAGKEQFFAKRFRRSKLGVEQDQEGNFVESDKDKFFTIKPEMLSWEGDVAVVMTSLLVTSEELEKADTLRMSNILVPMFEQPKELMLKPAKELLKSFNKDPKKWLPEEWLEQPKQETPQGTQVPADVQRVLDAPTADKADTVVPSDELDSQPSLAGRFGAAFNAFRNPQP